MNEFMSKLMSELTNEELSIIISGKALHLIDKWNTGCSAAQEQPSERAASVSYASL